MQGNRTACREGRDKKNFRNELISDEECPSLCYTKYILIIICSINFLRIRYSIHSIFLKFIRDSSEVFHIWEQTILTSDLKRRRGRELWQLAWTRREYSQLFCVWLLCLPITLCTYSHLALFLKGLLTSLSISLMRVMSLLRTGIVPFPSKSCGVALAAW